MHRSRQQDQGTVTTLRARDPVSIAIDIIPNLLNLQMLPIAHMDLHARSSPLIEIPPLVIETAGGKTKRI